jgi:general secretion pathway protein G
MDMVSGREIGAVRKTKERTSGLMPAFGRKKRRAVFVGRRRKHTHLGFTMVELMIVMAIIAILAALATLLFSTFRERARVARAVAEIHSIQNDITAFQIDQSRLPVDLAEVNWNTHNDPWGHPYQYTNFQTTPKGHWRKDKFLVPINSTFDLWSMGPDGKSIAPLTAPVSKDDIIRANDGSFIGKAALY